MNSPTSHQQRHNVPQQRGHTETGPRFKVSSERPEKRGIDLATPGLVVQRRVLEDVHNRIHQLKRINVYCLFNISSSLLNLAIKNQPSVNLDTSSYSVPINGSYRVS